MEQNTTFEFSLIKLILKVIFLLLALSIIELYFDPVAADFAKNIDVPIGFKIVIGIVLYVVLLLIVWAFIYGANRKTRKDGTRN